jgi:hypothetical protein
VIGVATTRQRPAKARPKPSNQPTAFTQRQNLTEAVGLALVRCWTKQQQEYQHELQAAAEAAQDTPSSKSGETWRSHRTRTRDQGHLVRQAARAVEYEQMLALREEGLRVGEIAQRLGTSRGTVHH